MPFQLQKAHRLDGVPLRTVWHEFTPLAMEHKAVMLGQGFPSFPPPPFVVQTLGEVNVSSDPLVHQYCRASGHMTLVSALQKRYADRLKRPISAEEVIVCNGTTQALNAAILAFIEPGDEVIVIEPFFDLYQNDIEMAGGKCVIVGMVDDPDSANRWEINWPELEASLNSKSKAIIVNTPQNVPGKVWATAELERMASLAKQHNLLLMSDEVYDELVFGDARHLSIGSLSDMYERTITCASIGKTLSCTGWKIGWCVGPADLIAAISQVHAHQCFSVATPLQVTVGRCIAEMATNGYLPELRATYIRRRDALVDGLRSAGLRPVVPDGSFFVLADIRGIDERHYYDSAITDVARDWQFCRWLTREIGVGAIPCTAFCRRSSWPQYEKYIRFAFCKSDETIAEGVVRLQRLRSFAKGLEPSAGGQPPSH